MAETWVLNATISFPSSNLSGAFTSNGNSYSGVKQSDPEPETPTNACLIDGTVYGIKTGTALVNGTAQTIYNGRTLVAGAGYDIVLSSSEFTVTIEGRGSTQTSWVVINGTTYISPTTLTVESGTMITLHTEGNSQTARQETRITIDGVTVVQGTTSHAASYIYTPTGDITITLSSKAGGLGGRYGVIDITTT